MPLGVVVERREIDNPWADHVWRPVAVIPGAGPVAEWKPLDEGAGWARYHIATLPLELHRTDTEAYRTNLSNDPPVVYVRLTDAADEAEHEIEAFLVTASPYEAQDYLDSGEEIVEGVPMPDGVIAWVQDFIDTHHVDKPFVKRRQRRHDDGAAPGRRRAGPNG